MKYPVISGRKEIIQLPSKIIGLYVKYEWVFKDFRSIRKWGIKERRINTLCLEGRIEGAIKFGNTWAIPEGAEKPKDERVTSGKHIKKKE